VGGFTLVEMLVAMAVLVIIIYTVGRMTSSTSTITTYNQKHMSVDDEAREVLDRMGADFSAMMIRNDVDCLIQSGTDPASGSANDSIYFYSASPAYFSGTTTDQNAVGLIGYRINSDYQLERLAKGLAWDGAPTNSGSGSMVFLSNPTPSTLDPMPSPTPTPYPGVGTIAGAWPSVVSLSSTDADFQVLGPQTYRLEFSFLLTNGGFSNTPYLPTHTAINGFQDVSAIVVTIALLDSGSRRTVSSSSMSQAVAALPYSQLSDFTQNPPKLTAQSWLEAVNTSTFAETSGLPQTAAAQVNVYQRFFYLTH
jgi:prepilin-type N-terminal cleavage/methylation domain-containing protein